MEEKIINKHIEHLEKKFKFDSSGTAFSVFELIKAYRELDKDFYCGVHRSMCSKQCSECENEL